MTLEIKNFKNPIDARKRLAYLENIEKNTDTDVLEILSNASNKKDCNEKVRQLKAYI